MKVEHFLWIVAGVIVICLIVGVIGGLQGCSQAPEEPGELDGQVMMNFYGEFFIVHHIGNKITLTWITPKKALQLLAEDKDASETLAEKLGVEESQEVKGR
jgi:hypothetical protein